MIAREDRERMLKDICVSLPYGVEDKELLFKDLCARLYYGLIINVNGHDEKVDEVNPFEGIITCGFQSFDVEECKPYLRPMSSMTEDERKEYELLANRCITNSVGFIHFEAQELIDWLIKNHFDFRGLIPKGLAIEVKEENNPYKE